MKAFMFFKVSIVFLIVLQPFFLDAQDYKLFTANSKKLYTDYPLPLNTYSLSIESAQKIGNDSVYYNFFKLSSEWIESDTCWFWGGPECNQQNVPTWAGKKIKFDNLESYTFYNLDNDSLYFYFNTEIDGPALFYYDSVQEFSIMYAATDTITVLGNPDTARYFTILHSDHDGNEIDSPLNGQNIIISKEFGLVRFFVIDSFPSVLKPISIIGNVSPTAGFYQLTNEMVYDYQVGDEIQYKESNWHYYGPPWENFIRYRKQIYLERGETADSLIYRIHQELFYEDSAGIEIDTITKKYLRSKVIAQIPFEKFNGSTRKLKYVDYCGQSCWTYSFEPIEDFGFCDADTCWGTIDLGRPPDYLYTSYVIGLGLHTNIASNPWPDWSYNIRKKINYFKKNNEECGNEVIVGIDDFNKPTNEIVLSPNPSNGKVHISSSHDMKLLILRDLYGSTILTQSISNNEITIDVSQLSNGLYFAIILLENGEIVTKKFVVLKR